MKAIFLTILGVTATACGPLYYAPNSQNIPIMEEKGQTNISMGINGTELTSGFEIQGAYGLTDNIALQLNTDWVTSSLDEGKGNLTEIGVGYYKKVEPNFVFETYGLVGFGGVKNVDYESDYNKDLTANFLRLGIQPSFSFSSKYFTASLSSRLANINYHNINGNVIDAGYLNANNSQWLFEPGLTLQAGFENVKLQLQYIHSYNLTNSLFEQDHELLSIGLKLNIMP